MRAPFRGLDSEVAVYIYRRNLPHWRQDGATYMVTFRLADSIPRHILEGWIEERRVWLAAYGLTDDLPEAVWRDRYLAIATVDRHAFERDQSRKLFVELDLCHGACWLRQPAIGKLVTDALRFHDGVVLDCGDFVVMPNHVHWLVRPIATQALESLLQSVKRFVATRANRALARTGQLWQKENHDHLVRNRTELERTRRYIEDNPRNAGLHPGEYVSYRADWLDADPVAPKSVGRAGSQSELGATSAA